MIRKIRSGAGRPRVRERLEEPLDVEIEEATPLGLSADDIESAPGAAEGYLPPIAPSPFICTPLTSLSPIAHRDQSKWTARACSEGNRL